MSRDHYGPVYYRAVYYRAVAKSVGVPEFWLEDAGQDLAFAAWRDGRDDPLSVRRNAIDCARRYGAYGRSGPKMRLVRLEEARTAVVDPFGASEAVLDALPALAALTAAQRRLLGLWLAGEKLTVAEYGRMQRARHKAQYRLMAA